MKIEDNTTTNCLVSMFAFMASAAVYSGQVAADDSQLENQLSNNVLHHRPGYDRCHCIHYG